MSCNNCFNGCQDIKPDKCIKYTGVDITALNIHNGDTLLSVENSIIQYILSIISGDGVVPVIQQDIICSTVKDFISPTGDSVTLNDVLTALIKSSCFLQEQVDAIVDALTKLETPYNTGCLTVSTNNTHNVLQAAVTAICALADELEVLALNLETNYVNVNDLNSLIAEYLNSISSSSAMRNKMVPNVAYEFYGDTSGKFDMNGVGIVGTDWEKIYICNGYNGLTPDKRGRVGVGAIVGAGGGTLSDTVNPTTPTNPNYSLGMVTGANVVSLEVTNLPSHTHVANPTVTDTGHSHKIFNSDAGAETAADVTGSNTANHRHDVESGLSYRVTGSVTSATLGDSSSNSAGITVNVTNNPVGDGVAHSNIQPSIAAHYIMYIP